VIARNDDDDDDSQAASKSNGHVDLNEIIKEFTAAGGSNGSNVFAENALTKLSQDDEVDECSICMDGMERPMMFPKCMHKWFACISSNLILYTKR
jgi:DNA repair protein RAD5